MFTVPRRRAPTASAPRALLLLICSLLVVPSAASSQITPPPSPSHTVASPEPRIGEVTAERHLVGVSTNALFMGTVAGVRAALDDRSFSEAFARGALGGGIAYAGKWAATRDRNLAGWAGRWIHGIGVSVADNAAEGRGLGERVVLPTGPFRIVMRFDRQGDTRVTNVQLDPVEAAGIAWALTRDDLEFDRQATRRAGALVFRSGDAVLDVGGERVESWLLTPGVVLLDGPGRGWDERVARGALQSLQYDAGRVLVTDPVNEALLDRVRAVTPLRAHLSIDAVLFPLRTGLVSLTGRMGRDTPWAWEARWLTTTEGGF